MDKLTDKEIITLLNSLINSNDLKLKINIKKDIYSYYITGTLVYKGRKLTTVKETEEFNHEW